MTVHTKFYKFTADGYPLYTIKDEDSRKELVQTMFVVGNALYTVGDRVFSVSAIYSGYLENCLETEFTLNGQGRQ